VVTLGVIFFGMRAGDVGFSTAGESARYGLFQVVSVVTTTGYGTADFDGWNNFSRGILLLLMFVGGCAGSTGGGMKVIRHILFYKILRLEIEKAHRPRVVRFLRIGGSTVEDPNLAHSIVVYFSMILAIFVFSWLLLITFEPNSTWGESETQSTLDEKLLDSASAVAATLNNIGPGLGVVGATQNYAGFSQGAKLLFVWLMMLGRVEVFSVLVLIFPAFWRRV
jgi:trk system potassium uptake protein TrkH